MAKGMPADPLRNTHFSGGWLEYFLADAIRPDRNLAELLIAGEDPIFFLGIAANGSPLSKLLKSRAVERNRLV